MSAAASVKRCVFRKLKRSGSLKNHSSIMEKRIIIKKKSNSVSCGLIIFLIVCTLSAHHQLGLPHYLYSEEYPQIPTMVIDADAEGYTATFAIFPGNPLPGQVVRIKVYIKHKNSGRVYTKPIEMSVSTESFFKGETIILEPRMVTAEYNEYKMSYQFDEPEKYYINVTFEPREKFLEKIPFPVVIGKTNFNLVPVISGIFFLTVFIIVGFTARKKKNKVAT